MNKKGLLNQIYIVIVLVVVLIAIIGLYSLGSIVLPIVVGEGTNTANTIHQSIVDGGLVELQNASAVASQATVNALGVFELITYFVFLGLIIGYIMIAYYVRTYPFLGFFWLGAIVALVVIAMIMSNAYEQAKNETDLNKFYTSWGTNDLLMSYLPHIVTVIGIIGGIILFALVSTESEAEVQRL